MLSRIGLLLVLLTLLAACTTATPQPPATATTAASTPIAQPSAEPSNTVVPATATTAPTDPAPSATTETVPTAANGDATPSAEATTVATAVATAPPAPTTDSGSNEDLTSQLPVSPILITAPGNGSQVVSPLQVTGQADPTFEQTLVVQLVSADGTQLGFTATQIQADVGTRGAFTAEVAFSVNEPTPAFIQVFSESAMNGTIENLNSVSVTLLPNGTAQIEANSNSLPRIHITSPAMGDAVSGGQFTLEGIGLPSFENTFLVEVVDADGTVITQLPISTDAPDVGQYGRFSTTISYSVTGPTPARVLVQDLSPAFGGPTFVDSITITLEP